MIRNVIARSCSRRIWGGSQPSNRIYRLWRIAYKLSTHWKTRLELLDSHVIEETHAFVVQHDAGQEDKVAQVVVCFEGSQHVLTTEQTGNRDFRAEKLVDNGQYLHVETFDAAQVCGKLFDDGASHGAGDEGDAARLRHASGELAFAARPLFNQVARHANAVLNLRVGAVVLRGWEVAPGDVVPFVGEVDEWVAVGAVGLEAPLVWLNLLDDGPCFGRGIVAQGRQFAHLNHVVIFGEADRHHRDGFDDRAQFCQILNAAIKVRAIVDGWAEYKLGMAGNAHAAQALDVIYDIARAWSVHHLAAQFGVGGMH